MTKQIGTVELLIDRIYPLHPGVPGDEVVVAPGVYPLYQDDDGSIYWSMVGRINEVFESMGDGLFVFDGKDHATGPEVSFVSGSFDPDEWEALLTDPVCVDGPARRLVITVNS